MTTHSAFRRVAQLAAACAVVALAHNVQAQTVRLHGATSLEKIMVAQKAALESQTGLKLEIVGNGAGRGLVDLSGGQADIAMIGGSLKGVAAVMNKEKAGSVDASGMKEIPLTSVKLVTIAHPGAGVKSLTEAQLRDVLTGKTANWKDVGGPDLPIKVVLPFAGDGGRITTQETLLGGAAFATGAVVRNSAKDICVVVAQLPGTCAVLSVKNVEGNVATVAMEKELAMPLQFVVKGEPAGDIKKVVDAAKALIK